MSSVRDGFELWGPLRKGSHVEGCSESLQTFFRDAQGHPQAHTRALEQSEQPRGVCFRTNMTYCRNFYLKIVVKSSLSAWLLTKKLFFAFDSRMINFVFLRLRNEIWKRLGVFLKLPNALDAICAPILKKLDFHSQTFIFTSIFL